MHHAELRQRYRDWKRLSTTRRTGAYTAIAADGTRVVVKVYACDAAGADRARQAREALQACAGTGVPALRETSLSDESVAHVLEHVPGIPRRAWRRESPLPPVVRVLDLALQWAETLARIHAARFVHRDIQPESIILCPASWRTWLIGFSLARPLGAVERRSAAATQVEGALAFIAPEQTGRMSRGCDGRSDLYALGATLYFALTGQPPFASDDPLELIHAHMARRPTPVSDVRPHVPEPVSRLVQKLLAKQPEERYQSALALHADLLALREQVAAGEVDPDFVLGSADALLRPRFVHARYGRELERAALAAAYARAAAGEPCAVWIAGPAGSGKSALVDALRPAVNAGSGYLAAGKFDLGSERPYAGWIDALSSLAEQLLIESDARLAEWRSALRDALGAVAGAIVEHVPDLAHILGDVPPVPALGPRETQARLALAMSRLIGIVAAPKHPLVLFLDDLQWSDSGSRFLLEELLAANTQNALLLVGAYRDDIPAGETPVPAMLERLTQRGTQAKSISLRPLDSSAATAMLADTLGRSTADVAPLAEHIERKTGNLPLLIRELVEHAHDRGLLRQAPGAGWTWDLDEIARAAIPDGAVALMTARIATLPERAREILELASCVGDQLDSGLLGDLCGHDVRSIEAALYALCDAGLLAPSTSGFCFTHDRIREATQARLSHDERALLHAEMARLLWSRVPEAERSARAFELADHLNRGRGHLAPELRSAVITMNLLAGQRALAAGAAAEAARYLAHGCAEVSVEDWGVRRELCFELHLRHAESAFLSRDFTTAFAILEMLDARDPSPAELCSIAIQRIRIWVLMKPPEECARYELAVLRKLGVRWPLHPSPLRAAVTLRFTARRLRRHGGTDLLRPATDANLPWKDVLRLIDAAGASLSRVDAYLIALASSFILRRSLDAGYISHPGFNLSNFALYSHAVLRDGAIARRCAEYARESLLRAPHPIYGPRTEFTLALVDAWLDSRRAAVAPMPRLADQLREAGDLEFAYFAQFQHAVHLALAGAPVGDVAAELGKLAERVRRFGHHYPNPEGCERAYRILTVTDITGLDLDAEQATAEAWFAAHRGSAETIIRTIWMMVLAIHDRHDLVFAHSDRLDPDAMRILPLVHVTDRLLYRGLAAAQLAATARGGARRRYLRALRASRRSLQRFASYAPDVVHMVLLLDAERAALRGRAQRAATLYENAARRAQRQRFVHAAALAHEQRARLLLRHGRATDAARSLAQAAELYERWGARAKAASLRPSSAVTRFRA